MSELRNKDGLTEEEFLKKYNPGDYERPSVTVDMVVFGMDKNLDKLKVLLIKRKDHPYIGCWALSGGFINSDESAYQAACRELEEETGLKDVYLEQFYVMTKPKRDPRMWVMSIDYLALIETTEVKAGDDADEALWFEITMNESKLELYNKEKGILMRYKLKRKNFKNGKIKVTGFVPEYTLGSELAFDHAETVLEGILRLREKLEHSDMAFNLVADEFTLPDLQRVYEVILGKDFYRGNFRSSMLGKIEPINDKKIVSVVGGKRSQAYKYRGKSL